MVTSNASTHGVGKGKKIVILDAGGQYCHLIARKVRELGIYAEIKPSGTRRKELESYQGIIISGGPSSVYSNDRPHIDQNVFELTRPILGICYGHQIMTEMLGGRVQRGQKGEYGVAQLKVNKPNPIFKGTSKMQKVWMNHRDVVAEVPSGFEISGSTDDCQIAAMANQKEKRYGLQFHPEVAHSELGHKILRNFVRDVCDCSDGKWKPTDRISSFISQIRQTVGDKRKVFFLVSGGVDSTVAFALCVKALSKERVKGLYVNTGFMRQYDNEAIDHLIKSGMDNIRVVDASSQFLDMLKSIRSPEKKRKLIGAKFLEITEKVLAEDIHGDRENWVLGQGTIYPDTIESGGTKNAAHIKTHHNRVSLIRKLISEGKVVEPIIDLYKDEVREVGLKLAKEMGLPSRLIHRHPFPGPGLAIRCLVSHGTKPINVPDAGADGMRKLTSVRKIAESHKLDVATLPLRTVGVKGDERSYDSAAVLLGRIPSANDENTQDLEKVSTAVTNNDLGINRVTYCLSQLTMQFDEWHVRRSAMTAERIKLLRDADNIVALYLEKHSFYDRVWQFPVVLLPFGRKESGGETIVLRPVDSIDGMTAQFSRLPIKLLRGLAREIQDNLLGIDAVLLDVTNKPPATIENYKMLNKVVSIPRRTRNIIWSYSGRHVEATLEHLSGILDSDFKESAGLLPEYRDSFSNTEAFHLALDNLSDVCGSLRKLLHQTRAATAVESIGFLEEQISRCKYLLLSDPISRSGEASAITRRTLNLLFFAKQKIKTRAAIVSTYPAEELKPEFTRTLPGITATSAKALNKPSVPSVPCLTIESLMLYQLYQSLFPAERMIVAGGKLVGEALSISALFDVTGRADETGVNADPDRLALALISMSETDSHLVAWLHSHPGTGKSATYPSPTDLGQEIDWLKHYSPLLISAIMVRDGFIRFWGKALDRGAVTVKIEGPGIRKCSETGHVYRLLGLGGNND